MNKKFLLSTCLILCFGLVACKSETTSNSASTQTSAEKVTSSQPETTTKKPEPTTKAPEPTTTAPKSISLTTSNITEYLIFDTTTSGVLITPELLDTERGKGTLFVTTSAKKSGKFENVTLTLTLETQSAGWGSMQKQTIEIPFDGMSLTSINIYSYIEKYVSNTPIYNVVVTGVTGSFTEN